MTHSALVEALLFSESRPFSLDEIAKALDISRQEIAPVIKELENNLSGRGIVLVSNNDKVALGTHPDATEIIEKLRTEELTGPLSKQALETLAIIAYGDNSSKSFIDALRGVNAQMTLRNLVERGLIERFTNPDDKRSFRYRLTIDALRHLGVSTVNELPGFSETHRALVERTTSQNSLGSESEETTEAL